MGTCDYSDARAEFSASSRQSRDRAILFASIAGIVLLVGAFLIGDVVTFAAAAGTALLAWAGVQLVGIGYLRTRPKNPAVGLSIVAGTATVLAVLLITPGGTAAVTIAGAWLACGAATEALRGSQWRRALTAEGTSGEVVRTLAVHTGYDGTPLVSFLSGGVLVGVWAAVLGALPWLTPFAILVHVAAALGLSASPRTR